MKKIIFVVVHQDLKVTLVEQDRENRNFIPLDNMSQLVNYLHDNNVDTIEDNVIEDHGDGKWIKELNDDCRLAKMQMSCCR